MKSTALLLPLLLCACYKPQVPDTERPPEPKAPRAGSAAAQLHAPLDRARAVQDTLDAAAKAERERIDAAGG